MIMHMQLKQQNLFSEGQKNTDVLLSPVTSLSVSLKKKILLGMCNRI